LKFWLIAGGHIDLLKYGGSVLNYTSYICNTDQTKSSVQRKFLDMWIYSSFSMLFMSTCNQLKLQGSITFVIHPQLKKQAHQDDPCTLYYGTV